MIDRWWISLQPSKTIDIFLHKTAWFVTKWLVLKKKKSGVMDPEATTEDAAEDELQEGIEENVENHQESEEAAAEKRSE